MIGNYVDTTAVKTNSPNTVTSVLSLLARQGMELPQPESVRDYLTRHVDLLDLLVQVAAQSRALFALETTLSLEKYHDPEIDDEYLTLYVQQALYDDAFWTQLEKIRASYETELAELSGWLHVTADFREGR
jgi:hypothetical protein